MSDTSDVYQGKQRYQRNCRQFFPYGAVHGKEYFEVAHQGDGEGCAGSGADGPETGPAEEEACPAAIRGLQVLVVPSGERIHGCQFGVGEGAADGEDAAEYPYADKQHRVGELACQKTAGGEYPRPDDIADDEKHGVGE